MAEPTEGTPQAMASISTRPIPSQRLGKTRMVAWAMIRSASGLGRGFRSSIDRGVANQPVQRFAIGEVAEDLQLHVRKVRAQAPRSPQ